MEGSLWNQLWAIKVPGKMKINFWRFAHGCLPSGLQLRLRHIPADDACVYCNRVESAGHAFLFCQFAVEVWHHIKSEYDLQLQRRNYYLQALGSGLHCSV